MVDEYSPNVIFVAAEDPIEALYQITIGVNVVWLMEVQSYLKTLPTTPATMALIRELDYAIPRNASDLIRGVSDMYGLDLQMSVDKVATPWR